MHRCVGKWVLKLMQGFFDSGSGISEPEDFTKKGMYNLIRTSLFMYFSHGFF